MLCAKCSTGVFEKDKVCAACGAKINRFKLLKSAARVIVLMLFVAGCAAYLMRARLFPGNMTMIPAIVAATTPPAVTEAPIEPDKPTPTVLPTSDLKKDIEDVWKMLGDIRNAAGTYIANHLDFSFTSKGGYLYDSMSMSYITIDALNRRGLIESKYRAENVMILYVKPDDLAGFAELGFGRGDELEVCTAYETIEGIALMTSHNYGILYRENFSPLLEKYNPDHGKVSRPQIASTEYAEVISAIQEYNFDEKAYDVRYLAIDSKYAYVVYSINDEPNTLRNCVLEWSGGWNVTINDAASGEAPYADINRTLPDFNESLMPLCNADLLMLAPTEYFLGPIDGLLARQTFARAELPVAFICGTYEAVYFELSSGGKYIAVLRDGTWEGLRVSQFIEAEDILKAAFRSNPPLLIVKQE